jgi:heme-degrading monooxygenase HmoA
MAHLLIRHNVEDYAKWKPFFDQNDKARRASGGGDYQLFRGASDPNEIVVLFEWDNLRNAQRFAESSDLREVMQRAGVIGRPDVFFLNEELD